MQPIPLPLLKQLLLHPVPIFMKLILRKNRALQWLLPTVSHRRNLLCQQLHTFAIAAYLL